MENSVQTAVSISTPSKNVLDILVEELTSPKATALAWVATVIGVVLAIIPLFLYFREKRSSEAMRQLVEEFQLAQKVREGLAHTRAEKEKIEAQSKALFDDVKAFESDIRERLPFEAKSAFLKNAIPAIEEQIFALSTQRDQMITSLKELTGEGLQSPTATQILSAESKARLTAKRQFESMQAQLAILTAFTSVILYLIPYPFDRIVAFIMGFPLAVIVARMVSLQQYVYPDSVIGRLVIRTKKNRYLRVVAITLYVVAAVLAASIAVLYFVQFGRFRF